MQLAGRYLLERRLAHGGFAEVWRGADQLHGRPVAIKVLFPEAAGAPQWLSKFRAEARIAARLAHPGITSVDDFGEYDGRWYLVMEFLEGHDLAVEIGRYPGGLPLERVRSFAAQIADALVAAHAHGVIHRDLKPGNVMVLANGLSKITDFGIARSPHATADQTIRGRVVGTPAYMAPEQWRGDEIDHRVDLYALGCILYALLTGRPPFTGDSVAALMGQHLSAVPGPVSALRPDVPPDLERLAHALLAKEAADRPADAAAVVAWLTGGRVEHGAGAVTVDMPSLGEDVTEGTVVLWYVAVGSQVRADEPLVEVSTDKVDIEIPAPCAGVLDEICARPDEVVRVGSPLARIRVARDGGG